MQRECVGDDGGLVLDERQRALRFIETHLAEPDLRPAVIATAAVGVVGERRAGGCGAGAASAVGAGASTVG
jgi:hypothetical protein